MASIFHSPDARRAVLERERSFLDRWPDLAEHVVDTRHGQTYVATCGRPTAPSVVLLHGAGFNSAAWTTDVATWSTTHRVVAIDVVGEPGRSAESRPPFDGDAYACWIDDVLDDLEIPSAAFVGASLGGWIAFDYAIRRPSRLGSLAALVPAGIGRQRFLPLLALVLAPFGARGRQAAADIILGPRPVPPEDPHLAELQQAMRDYLLVIQDSYRPRRDRLPRFTDEQIRQLTMPALVVLGEKDRLISASHTSRRLVQLLPDADVEVRPDVGHIPTDYTETVHRFLVETTPG